jgi:hypothetical protein
VPGTRSRSWRAWKDEESQQASPAYRREARLRLTRVVGSKEMKRKIIIACTVLVLLPVLAIGVQALRVISALHAQEKVIKDALRTASPGTLQSNATDGAERFLKTGELVFELSYLRDPAGLKQRTMLNMRVHPRVSTHRSDGWVGIYQGNWYVKML